MKIIFIISLLLITLSAWAISSHTLSWSAPTTYADGTPLSETVTYNIYQTIGTTTTKIAANVSGLSVTVSLKAGSSTFQVTAVTADGRESAISNVVSFTAVDPLPSPPTNVTIH